jgi:hypothetical protein
VGHIKHEGPHLCRITDPGTLSPELDRVRRHYDHVRLHEGSGYVKPIDEHEGRGDKSGPPAASPAVAYRGPRPVTTGPEHRSTPVGTEYMNPLEAGVLAHLDVQLGLELLRGQPRASSSPAPTSPIRSAPACSTSCWGNDGAGRSPLVRSSDGISTFISWSPSVLPPTESLGVSGETGALRN